MTNTKKAVAGRVSKPFAALVGNRLTVPASVRDLKVCDLPVSVRLEKVLRTIKMTRLGDLNGVSLAELRKNRNCGKKTASEVVHLVEKAVAGGFDAITETSVNWSPIALTSFLDTLISELPDHVVEVLESRLSGERKQPPTLESVGIKYNLTRERIRQIMEESIQRLRKLGSRRLDAYLLHAQKICRKWGPLTPELYAQWLGEKAPLFRFSPSFYARLVCQLGPSILAWRGWMHPHLTKESFLPFL
ncbi:MAG: sigma factor-like helix-turn-helix DNA-binding protein [Verrucomicrobiota bacterium]|jgi:hypothetical protein